MGVAEMALHGARYSNLSHRRGYCTEIQLPPGGWLLHIPCARDKKGDTIRVVKKVLFKTLSVASTCVLQLILGCPRRVIEK